MSVKNSKETAGTNKLPAVVRIPLDFFSNVWLGVWLMIALFVYSTIGSAGILYPAKYNGEWTWIHEMPRQWRPFEMTEFEWFHTTTFLIISLGIAINISVVTIRKIPFNMLKLGVWMIHTGILIMTGGALLYFGTKFEGDTPVVRREIVASINGVDGSARFAAAPRAGGQIESPEGTWSFEVSQVTPLYPLGEDENGDGEEDVEYSVFVTVTSPNGELFSRRLVAGHPDLMEDVIPGQGLVANLPGSTGPLVNQPVELVMNPVPQTDFWIKDSRALYARTPGTDAWQMSVVDGVPRYNDYLSQPNEVWTNSASSALTLDPIDIDVPMTSEMTDLLEGATLDVTGYLRYAFMQERVLEGGDTFDPTIEIILSDSGGPVSRQLKAFSPQESSMAGGLIRFVWVDSEEQMWEIAERGRASLSLTVVGQDGSPDVTVQVPQQNLSAMSSAEQISGTEWSYRVLRVLRDLRLEAGEPGVSIAMVELSSPTKTISRWIFEDPNQSRDVDPNAQTMQEHGPADPAITSEFNAGETWRTLIVAGPDPIGVRVLDRGMGQQIAERDARPDRPIALLDGSEMTIRTFARNPTIMERPWIVPRMRRDQQQDRAGFQSMMQVTARWPDGSEQAVWLPYNNYVSDDPVYEQAGIASARSAFVTTPSGKQVEVRFGRERRSLPSAVRLDEFRLATHFGGFDGDTLSIRDWHSIVSFDDLSDDVENYDTVADISTNDPGAFHGLWYFQSTWDAPRSTNPSRGDPGRPGFAFTGLGVGNREGVWTMLIGCCISVIGMSYAFYIKPIIRRRREAAVYATLGNKNAALETVDATLREPNVVGATDGGSNTKTGGMS